MRRVAPQLATWTVAALLPPSVTVAAPISGTFDGVASVNVMTFELNELVGTTNGFGVATFSFSLDSGVTDASIENGFFPFSETFSGCTFSSSPGSVSVAFAIGSGGLGPPSFLSFDVTYQSISPNGVIDPSTAVVSAGFNISDIAGNFTGELARIDFFNSVPEPTSLVIGTIGLLSVAACAWRRRMCRLTFDHI
jgi:hypothetical protein